MLLGVPPVQEPAGTPAFFPYAFTIESSVNLCLDAQPSSISANTAPSMRMGDLLDGNTCATRDRRSSLRLARTCTLLVHRRLRCVWEKLR